MPNFIPYNPNQDAFIAINFLDQLQQGTFEHAIHYLVEHKLDLSVFYSAYNNDKVGRRAYDPAILLKIILFAYSKGITSSREIQWCCEKNVIFKALSCDKVPHFTTIADFVSSQPEAIEQLFEQIVLICYQQGLIGNELFAIDGCKMPSNAAKEWSGTHQELERKRDKIKRQISHLMNKHEQTDWLQKDKSALLQQQQRAEQTIETLNNSFNKIDEFLKISSPRIGNGKQKKEVKSNITDNESAKMTTSKGTIQGYNGLAAVDKKHQIVIDAQAFGEGQEHHSLQPVLESIKSRFKNVGISDDIYQQGAIVTADTGFANEANMKYLHDNNIDGYIPDNQFRSRDPKFQDQKENHKKPKRPKQKKETKIPSSEFTFDPVKLTCHCPAGESLSFKVQKKDNQGNEKVFFRGRATQCRSCHLKKSCMENPSAANDSKHGGGRQVSFILAKRRTPNYTDWMKHRIDSEKGKTIYSHRMSVVEPVFGNIGTNKGLIRFSLRGKKKVQGQWQLFCMVHNIEKLNNYGEMAA